MQRCECISSKAVNIFFLAMTLSWKVNVLIIPSMRPEKKRLTKSFN